MREKIHRAPPTAEGHKKHRQVSKGGFEGRARANMGRISAARVRCDEGECAVAEIKWLKSLLRPVEG